MSPILNNNDNNDKPPMYCSSYNSTLFSFTASTFIKVGKKLRFFLFILQLTPTLPSAIQNQYFPRSLKTFSSLILFGKKVILNPAELRATFSKNDHSLLLKPFPPLVSWDTHACSWPPYLTAQSQFLALLLPAASLLILHRDPSFFLSFYIFSWGSLIYFLGFNYNLLPTLSIM